jgi:hypothetical protein
MAALLKRKPATPVDANGAEINPDAVYFACESFSGSNPGGGDYVILIGETVKGSHPAMVNCSKFFIPGVSATSGDIQQANARIRFPDPGPDEVDPTAPRVGKPLKPEDQVVALESFRVPVAARNTVLGGLAGFTGALQLVNAGDTFDRRHWIVGKFPDRFEKLKKAKA